MSDSVHLLIGVPINKEDATYAVLGKMLRDWRADGTNAHNHYMLSGQKWHVDLSDDASEIFRRAIHHITSDSSALLCQSIDT